MTYKSIRENSLSIWLENSKRIRGINDDFSQSMECEWQNELVPKEYHSSLFCSIAEWSTNVTDLLEDTTYDQLRFDNMDNRQKLFRHYTRILLIASEILTDFQDLIIFTSKFKGSIKDKNIKAKSKLNYSEIEFTCQNLFDYINNICKHKVGNKPIGLIKYHLCNHHIDYQFKDNPNFERTMNTLKVKNIKTKKLKPNMKIEVPKLDEIIYQILHGYKAVDKSLKKRNLNRFIREQLSKYENKTLS